MLQRTQTTTEKIFTNVKSELNTTTMSEVTIYKPEFFKPAEQRMKEAGFSPEAVRKEISFALQHIGKSAQLQNCSQQSILQAVVNISNVGLSLNPASKEAYLIPRWNSSAKCMEAVLDPSYIGLTKLLTNTGSIISITTQLVYEGDVFEMDVANNSNPVRHRPQLVKSKRGNLLGVYALATLHNGVRQVEWMDVDDLNAIRERSETYKAYIDNKIKSCTWVSDYGEMCRKTVIKRIYKFLPRTEKLDFVDRAIEMDNKDYSASDEQVNYIESLLSTSSLDHEQRGFIESELSMMNPTRASQVISMLQMNQLNPDQGNLGNQKQTAKHIKSIAQ